MTTVILISALCLVAIALIYIIYCSFIKWSIMRVDGMSGKRFEKFVCQLYTKLGYRCEQTKASGDQGIDVILIKGFRKFGIQCKRYDGAVGNKAVQEAYAGKKFYNLHAVAVVTNRKFTHSAKALAKTSGVELIDRNDLKELLKKAKKLDKKV